MEVINYKELDKINPNVSCIGYFDGVHLGHKELIKKTVFYAKKFRLEPCLITFFPDPKSVVSGKESELINTFLKRCELFEKYGIKKVIVIDFNKRIMNMKPENFIKNILSKLKIQRLVCGFDFTYGKEGLGNTISLQKDLKEIKLTIVPAVKLNNKKISSTLIADELSKGHVANSNKLLGYDYSLLINIYDRKIYNNDTYIYANVIDNRIISIKNKQYKGYFKYKNYKYSLVFDYSNGIITFVLDGKININGELELYITE